MEVHASTEPEHAGGMSWLLQVLCLSCLRHLRVAGPYQEGCQQEGWHLLWFYAGLHGLREATGAAGAWVDESGSIVAEPAAVLSMSIEPLGAARFVSSAPESWILQALRPWLKNAAMEVGRWSWRDPGCVRPC